jgi:hypothetical protein
MKTTVDILDSLHEEARKVAASENSSIKALIEEGLRNVVDERKNRGRFRLRKAAFKGNGLQADLAGASWEKIRELAYESRGGTDASGTSGEVTPRRDVAGPVSAKPSGEAG